MPSARAVLAARTCAGALTVLATLTAPGAASVASPVPSPVVAPVPSSACGAGTAEPGSVGQVLVGLARLWCDPVEAAWLLPPTALEREEPQRLYAVVTRDQPVAPRDYAPDDLVPLPGGLYDARREVVEQLERLLEDAARAGRTGLVVQST